MLHFAGASYDTQQRKIGNNRGDPSSMGQGLTSGNSETHNRWDSVGFFQVPSNCPDLADLLTLCAQPLDLQPPTSAVGFEFQMIDRGQHPKNHAELLKDCSSLLVEVVFTLFQTQERLSVRLRALREQDRVNNMSNLCRKVIVPCSDDGRNMLGRATRCSDPAS